VVADSQYSESKLRSAVEKAAIPYPANQKKGLRALRSFELMDLKSKRRNIIRDRLLKR
jgi:hypothetical protein